MDEIENGVQSVDADVPVDAPVEEPADLPVEPDRPAKFFKFPGSARTPEEVAADEEYIKTHGAPEWIKQAYANELKISQAQSNEV